MTNSTEHEFLYVKDDISLHVDQFNLTYAGETEGWATYRHQNIDAARNYIATLFPGVFAVLTDYHNQCAFSVPNSEGAYIPMLSICYAFAGRMEWNISSVNRHAYFPPENLLLYSYARHETYADFPDRYFRCLELNLCLPLPAETVDLFADFGIDWELISSRYAKEQVVLIRGTEAIQQFLANYDPAELKRPAAFRLLCLYLLNFLENYDGSLDGPVAYLPGERVRQLAQVAAGLKANLRASPTLADLASQTGISRTYLQQQFKTVYGMSIHAYHKRLRLQEAARLLSETNQSIASIAEAIGYSHQGKFAVAFKKQFGSSPQIYRQTADRNRKV